MERHEKETTQQPVTHSKNEMPFLKALSESFKKVGVAFAAMGIAMRRTYSTLPTFMISAQSNSYVNIQRNPIRVPIPEEYENFMEVTGTQLEDSDSSTVNISDTYSSYSYPTTYTAPGYYSYRESSPTMSTQDEVDKLSIISKRLKVGFRELLSAFTKLGEVLFLRRDSLIDDFLAELNDKFDSTSNINLSNIRHIIFLCRGKYIGGKFFRNSHVADTIDFLVEETQKPSEIRTIRVSKHEPPAPKVFISFNKKEDIFFGDCSLLFKIYDTNENVIFVDNKIRRL